MKVNTPYRVNKLPYKVKLLGLGALIAAGSLLSSCEKKCAGGCGENQKCENGKCVDIQIPTPPTPPVTPPTDTIVTPPIDPNEELKKEIAKLEKDSTEATDNCRTARHDAIYNPEDISSKWNVIFSAGGDFYANNFKDTIDRDTIVVNTLYTNYGDPLPSNDQSIKAYKGSIISWNDVVATLANKRNQLTK